MAPSSRLVTTCLSVCVPASAVLFVVMHFLFSLVTPHLSVCLPLLVCSTLTSHRNCIYLCNIEIILQVQDLKLIDGLSDKVVSTFLQVSCLLLSDLQLDTSCSA